MFKKEYAMFFLVFLMLFASGCGGQKQDDAATAANPFVGGNEGLELSFLQQQPPAEVFDRGTYPFDVVVKVENKGEYEVLSQQARFRITSINPQLFSISQNDLTKYMPESLGKRTRLIQGGQSVIEFKNLNYVSTIIGRSQDNLIRVESCYQYKTEAVADLCIKKPTTLVERNPICDITGTKRVYNSGAPIQITKVEQQAAGTNRIQVAFTISHVGRGDSFYDVSDSDCAERTNEYKVWVKLIPQETNIPFTCSGMTGKEGYVTLYNGQPRTVICTIDVSGITGEYISRLGFELSYRYLQHIDTTMKIRSSD